MRTRCLVRAGRFERVGGFRQDRRTCTIGHRTNRVAGRHSPDTDKVSFSAPLVATPRCGQAIDPGASTDRGGVMGPVVARSVPSRGRGDQVEEQDFCLKNQEYQRKRCRAQRLHDKTVTETTKPRSNHV